MMSRTFAPAATRSWIGSGGISACRDRRPRSDAMNDLASAPDSLPQPGGLPNRTTQSDRTSIHWAGDRAFKRQLVKTAAVETSPHAERQRSTAPRVIQFVLPQLGHGAVLLAGVGHSRLPIGSTRGGGESMNLKLA